MSSDVWVEGKEGRKLAVTLRAKGPVEFTIFEPREIEKSDGATLGADEPVAKWRLTAASKADRYVLFEIARVSAEYANQTPGQFRDVEVPEWGEGEVDDATHSAVVDEDEEGAYLHTLNLFGRGDGTLQMVPADDGLVFRILEDPAESTEPDGQVQVDYVDELRKLVGHVTHQIDVFEGRDWHPEDEGSDAGRKNRSNNHEEGDMSSDIWIEGEDGGVIGPASRARGPLTISFFEEGEDSKYHVPVGGWFVTATNRADRKRMVEVARIAAEAANRGLDAPVEVPMWNEEEPEEDVGYTFEWPDPDLEGDERPQVEVFRGRNKSMLRILMRDPLEFMLVSPDEGSGPERLASVKLSPRGLADLSGFLAHQANVFEGYDWHPDDEEG